MKYAAGPRKELGVRTVFNILGPVSNPAGVTRQLVGVYDKALLPLMVNVLEMTGSKHVIVAHSRDGLDEFSVAAPTDYIELRHGERSHGAFEPERAGFDRHAVDALRGGDAAHNVAILERVLQGKRSPYRDSVVLNAGVMIYVGGRSESIVEGVKLAAAALDKGAAAETLGNWVRLSNDQR
jgi:anthranilate phosphoribosyltransferase